VKSTDGADYSALSYLVKTNEIVYAPSASVIAAIRGTGGNPTVREGASKSVLIIADPVFNSSESARQRSGGDCHCRRITRTRTWP